MIYAQYSPYSRFPTFKDTLGNRSIAPDALLAMITALKEARDFSLWLYNAAQHFAYIIFAIVNTIFNDIPVADLCLSTNEPQLLALDPQLNSHYMFAWKRTPWSSFSLIRKLIGSRLRTKIRDQFHSLRSEDSLGERTIKTRANSV